MRAAALFASVIIASCLASAAASPDLRLSSTSIQTNGETRWDGALAALDQRFTGMPGAISLAISARAVQVETDSVTYMQAGGVATGTRPPTLNATEYGSSNVTAHTWDSSSSLFATAGPSARLRTESQGLSIFVPTQPCRHQPDYFAGARAPICPDLAGSAGASLAPTADGLRVNGTFAILLWGWEGTVQSNGQSTGFWSGQRYIGPQTAPVGARPSELRYVQVRVTEGELRLASPGVRTDVFTRDSTVSAPDIAFLGGTANGSRVSDGTVGIFRDGAALTATVTSGKIIHPDGTTQVIGTGRRSRAALWGLAIGLVAMAPLTAWLASGASARRHVREAQRSLEIGNLHAAARHAESAMRHASTRLQGAMLGSIALIRAGDFEDAGQFVRALKSQRDADGAAVAFVEACLHAGQGDRPAALASLRLCLATNPAYREEAAANPYLRDLLAESGAYS